MSSARKRGFDGLLVAGFESRMAEDMKHLIESHGGRGLVTPSTRELRLDENTEVMAFGKDLLAGKYDILIFLTATGAKALVQILETRYPRAAIVAALARVTRACRGTKDAAALSSLGLDPDIVAPEPNTWRELLGALDDEAPVAGKRVAVQEYDISNLELLQGLEERGATITRVPIYSRSLPEDLGPLEEALRTLADGGVDVALFTSANQVDSIMSVARDLGLDDRVRGALNRAVVASVGSVSSQSLLDHGVRVDLEPPHAKMDLLVREASLRCHEILASKRDAPRRTPAAARATRSVRSADDKAIRGGTTARPAVDENALMQSRFMRACRREPNTVTPVWLMRQAGRYMREYRRLRASMSFLELCKDPGLVTRVTVHAVEQLKVDAAIIFADLLLPVEAMGLRLTYEKDGGPAIEPTVCTGEDVDRLREADVEETLGYVLEAIRRTRAALPPGIPLIGFAGAPFTLASYMIEGKGSRSFIHTKGLLYRDRGVWDALLERIVRLTASYLNAQIASGAQAVQIFDSWVGCLAPADYRDFVLPHTRKLISSLRPGVPVIHFGTQTATLLEMMREAGGDVMGLDWRVDLMEAWNRLGEVAVMGNLDPVVLFAPREEVRRRVRELLRSVGGRPGHIFNLGHGILPRTPLDNVLALVDAVHEWGGA